MEDYRKMAEEIIRQYDKSLVDAIVDVLRTIAEKNRDEYAAIALGFFMGALAMLIVYPVIFIWVIGG